MSATTSMLSPLRRSHLPVAERALGAIQRALVPAACILVVAVLVGLEVAAIFNHYEMRVTADTPTFMALVRDLAIHPLTPDSVFFGTADTRSIHASPYLQVLALIWKLAAPTGGIAEPMALGRFLAIVTIPVTLFVLAMLWLYAKEVGSRTAAFVAIPALLLTFGPAHIAFPSDLTINGFISTGYFPTTFATGLTLAVLLALRRRSWRWTAASVVLCAATLTTDPLNGAVLVVLMVGYACLRARAEPNESVRVPLILIWSFLLAGTWPAFDVWRAFGSSGLPVPALMIVALVAPQLCRVPLPPLRPLGALFRRARSMDIRAETERRFALLGAWAVVLIALLSIYTMKHWPTDHPILQAYRLGFYWNDQRDRWLLLFLPGACGLIGLYRLAVRGRAEMLLWFVVFYAAGLVGAVVHLAAGLQLPFYYRFILICQTPVAIGVGAFAARHKSRVAGWLLAGTLLVAFTFKVASLVTAPTNLSYFGAPLPAIWSIAEVVPPSSGVVASDPNTSYFVPIAAGDRVLTLGPGHADSGDEQQRAAAGYELLREVYEGSAAQASGALRRMWSAGVRWVVVEKFTTFAPVGLRDLFSGPYDGLITGSDVPRLATYDSRLAAAGDEVHDDGEFIVFRLSPAKLAQATSGSRSIGPRDRGRIRALLARITRGDEATARAVSPELQRLGVRTVTLSMGVLGATPRLSAYGASIADSQVVSIDVAGGRWVSYCAVNCGSAADTAVIKALGDTAHADPRFSTIVRLGPAER